VSIIELKTVELHESVNAVAHSILQYTLSTIYTSAYVNKRTDMGTPGVMTTSHESLCSLTVLGSDPR